VNTLKIGIDGCKAGWFLVAFDGSDFDIGAVATINDVIDRHPSVEEIIIDIPIGLHDSGKVPRDCDVLARKLLKPRGSTVFPAPLRPSVYAQDYSEACRVNHALSGKKLSKQAYNICHKIREVDQLLTQQDGLRNIIHEAHPELGFCLLNGGKPLTSKKKRTEGINDRLRLLAKVLPDAHQVYAKALQAYPRKLVARDDIVDAMLCLSIALADSGERITIPSPVEYDDAGLQMVMHSLAMH
jgi:predicted RNase H-like nuclease